MTSSRLPLDHLSLIPEELADGSRVHAGEDAVAGREHEATVSASDIGHGRFHVSPLIVSVLTEAIAFF